MLYAMHEVGTREIHEFDHQGNPYFLIGNGIKIFTIKKV